MIRTAHLAQGAFFALTVAAAPAQAQHTASRNATLPLDGATRVEIIARAGNLRVVGANAGSSVTVSGTARASNADLLSRIRLVAERRGDVIHIEAVMPEERSARELFGLLNAWSALDLDITIPAGTAVVATDGSGDAEFRGTGALRVRDGSGNLRISDVMGEVDVHDGSGDLTIVNVTGPLNVRDASGGILIEGVGRDITISDGSGDMVLRRVGNVTITSDGSGSIEISDASGNVRIESDGSGSITVRDVAGDFTVGRAGSGRVRHQNVQGRVEIPRR